MQNSVPIIRITSLYGSQPSSVFFLHAKQRLLDLNNKSLWVPDITCRLVHVKQRAYLQHQTTVSMVPALICGFLHA